MNILTKKLLMYSEGYVPPDNPLIGYAINGPYTDDRGQSVYVLIYVYTPTKDGKKIAEYTLTQIGNNTFDDLYYLYEYMQPYYAELHGNEVKYDLRQYGESIFPDAYSTEGLTKQLDSTFKTFVKNRLAVSPFDDERSDLPTFSDIETIRDELAECAIKYHSGLPAECKYIEDSALGVLSKVKSHYTSTGIRVVYLAFTMVKASADISGLSSLIQQAQQLLGSAVVSTDGSDVPTNQYWIPQSYNIELGNAISSAITLKNQGSNADYQAVEDMKTQLQAAMDKFRSARKYGTKQVPDISGLNSLIQQAQSTLDSTVFSTDGSDIPDTQLWVPQSVWQALAKEYKKQKI